MGEAGGEPKPGPQPEVVPLRSDQRDADAAVLIGGAEMPAFAVGENHHPRPRRKQLQQPVTDRDSALRRQVEVVFAAALLARVTMQLHLDRFGLFRGEGLKLGVVERGDVVLLEQDVVVLGAPILRIGDEILIGGLAPGPALAASSFGEN